MVYAAVHGDFNMIVDTIAVHQVSDPEHSRKLYMSAKNYNGTGYEGCDYFTDTSGDAEPNTKRVVQ